MSGAPVRSAQPAAPQGARDLLLDAAGAIMREGDQVDLSLSELAARAGLNSALVKYYFGNKAGLLKALIEREWVEIVRSVEALMAKNADPETKLRIHMAGVVNNLFHHPYVHRLLLRMIRESDEAEGQRLADAYLNPLLAAYQRLIGEGVEAGVFRAVDPVLFYFTVIGAADRFFSAGPVLRHCGGPDVLDEAWRDRYRQHLNEFVAASILVPR